MSLKPIVMTPAYRYGAATPWGGNVLRTLYGQDIPDEKTRRPMATTHIRNMSAVLPQTAWRRHFSWIMSGLS